MDYRLLGKSGLKISAISLGSWLTFGQSVNDPATEACMSAAYDAGVNFFDGAEGYGHGAAEEAMGRVFKKTGWRRDTLIISTKVFNWGNKPTQGGVSRKHLVESVDAALQRMGLDYVDLCFCHRPDGVTPPEEIVHTMSQLMFRGKILYWGTSEFSPAELIDLILFARQHGLPAPIVEQTNHSMLYRRRVEGDLKPLCERFGLGTTIFSPLAQGVLSGKYNQGMPSEGRINANSPDWQKNLLTQANLDKVRQLAGIAAELSISMAQMALAWCLKNPHVSSVLTGASRPEQVRENVKAVDAVTKLDAPSMARIEKIFGKSTMKLLREKHMRNRSHGAGRHFTIQVVDQETGRGVPLVELSTTNALAYYTDSAGLIAFLEPGMMGRPVFFKIKSHGYEYPHKVVNIPGVTLKPTPGGRATLKINRINIAPRLYRITGEGIYHDSVLLGVKTSIARPLGNALVGGQDSVFATPYRGKIYWFWGDTTRTGAPWGHFRTAGATSQLPGRGGLDPSVGVDFTYFEDREGFSRPMCPLPQRKKGLVWIDRLTTLPSEKGEILVTNYYVTKGLHGMLEHGLMVYDDAAETFHRHCRFSMDKWWRAHGGHTSPWRVDGRDYCLITHNLPILRVRAELKFIADQRQYETFTCLPRGSRYDKEKSKPERDSAGRVVWDWKLDADQVGQHQERELLEAGKLKPSEARFQIRDVESGKPVYISRATVDYNPFRRQWIMIAVESNGTSALGEIWFAAADVPTGPWRWARKIVTHDRYSFYNPVHHPFFDQQGGRIIYFEGTYVESFSGNLCLTPRYNYNQIMYQLDLGDPRLAGPPGGKTPGKPGIPPRKTTRPVANKAPINRRLGGRRR